MDFLVDQLKFLGLNDREVKVFTALATFGRMNMTKISSRAGLSRTTVDAIVRRLIRQGLLTQERVAGHTEYAVRLGEVADKLDWLEKRLRPSVGEVATQSAQANGAPVHPAHMEDRVACVVSGHPKIHTLVANTFLTHQDERVMMLLSSIAPTKERMARFEHCIGYAREARVKLELLTTTDVAKELSPYAKEILALLASYDLRLNFLPPSFCFEFIDLVAFRDVILLINQHTESAEQVTSENVVLVFNHLLRVAREAGWGMDIRMWLQNMLQNNEEPVHH